MSDTTATSNLRLPVAAPAALAGLAASARALQPVLVADRRHLHADPELGWEEARTTAFVAERLGPLGYRLRVGSAFLGDARRLGDTAKVRAETGCAADLDMGRPGRTVAIRIDLDALPIAEAEGDHRPTREGWGSRRPGVMHACAHDGHVAIGLGVACLLAERAADCAGRIRLLFQPAEEGTRGAGSLVEAGWFDNVDVLLAFHIGFGVPSGCLALGMRGFLATRKFTVRLDGQAAHAGKAPEQGRNALVGACQIVLGLQALAQSSRPGIRVNVGTLRSGTGLNIVPETAEFGFELRAGRQQDLDDLAARAIALVEGIAGAHGLRLDIMLVGEAPDWANPREVASWAGHVAQGIGTFPTTIMNHDFGASEDATLLLHAVAARGGLGGYFGLGSDLAAPHHTPGFDFDEEVLAAGAAFIAGLALSALQPS